MKILLVIYGFLCFASKPAAQNSQADIGCDNRSTPLYMLPFSPGTRFYLLQGNCGKHSHFGEDRFAFDFRMPVGTCIIAMRAGIVVNYREQFRDGSNTNDSLNFLIILHEDSTASRYLHLAYQGVLVEKGQWVNAGDTIARSGNTGRSTEPHLHVDVTGFCTKAPCQTIPFSFLNTEERVPVQGRYYQAFSR